MQSEASVDAAVAKIIAESGRIDVLVHNAGHMVFGPAEAFTPEQFAELYDVNVLEHPARQPRGAAAPAPAEAGAAGLGVEQQLRRRHAALPRALFRRQGGDGRARGPVCARAARWGIETSIVVPGAFTKGTNHFAHSGRPADAARAAEYEAGPYNGFGEQVQKAFAEIVPADADAGSVADAIVEVVDTPFGKRPFRVHIDPDAGRRRCRLHRARSRPRRDAASGRTRRSPEAEKAGLRAMDQRISKTSGAVGIDGAAPMRCTQIEAAALA